MSGGSLVHLSNYARHLIDYSIVYSPVQHPHTCDKTLSVYHSKKYGFFSSIHVAQKVEIENHLYCFTHIV